jgi:hypothetical protein
MSILRSRGTIALAGSIAGLVLGPAIAQGATYAVRVRWEASPSAGVAGYRVAVQARAGGSPLVLDAGLPSPGADGSLAAQVSGLDGRTDYDVTVRAYTSTGLESVPSNAIAIGYAQVAARIDTDGDGLSDATEDPNLNRTVDPGETDALSPDTDADGVGDASDLCQGTAPGTSVDASGCPCTQATCGTADATIWPATAAPVRADRGADNAVELGVRFRSDVAGYVTGIRFYKHVLNTGTHVGNLWSSSGTRLATATFSGETASGWQQVTFASPVAIAANTTYVASYHCPNGHFSFDVGYFATQGVDRPPLHALSSPAAGGNDVFVYGATSSFPTETYAATNYWVDVVFSPTTTLPPPPVTITTTALPDGMVGTAYAVTLAASGGTPPYTWTVASGALPPGLTLNATTGVIAGTPTTAGISTITVQATTGAQSASRTLTITIAPPPSSGAQSIWSATAVPTGTDAGPDSAVELGVKFRADVAGDVTGIRFYKHALNTGTHVGNLWTSTGTRLASATFTGESASGWQQVTFASPVAIAANTVYVASYLSPNGHYSEDDYYFSAGGVDRPPLHALANGEAGPNSVYAYGAPSRFPTQTWRASNYWVDVTFVPAASAVTSALDVSTGATAGAVRPGTQSAGGAGPGLVGNAALRECSGNGARIRRFTLRRDGSSSRLTAIGRFAFPAGLDLGAAGVTTTLEDGAHRLLLAVALDGSDLEASPSGWRTRANAPGVERVVVRRRRGHVIVRLRGRVPDPGGGEGSLVWGVQFGTGCAEAIELTCTGAGRGRRRCRGQP